MKGNGISYENYPSIRALRGETVKNVKLFVGHPVKEYFVEASAIPIYSTNGYLTMVVSYSHDFTKAIKQSRKIIEQKKKLESIIENLVDVISIFDSKDNLYYLIILKDKCISYYEDMDKIS